MNFLFESLPYVQSTGSPVGIFLGSSVHGNGDLMRIFAFVTASLLMTVSAHSQTSSKAELTCRNQAKETAVQTYSSCITTARNSQVDEIRKNYQKDLAGIKAKYDEELKKLSHLPATVAAATTKSSAKKTKSSKAAKSQKVLKSQSQELVTELPPKLTPSVEAPPVQNDSDWSTLSSVESKAAVDTVDFEEAPLE